MVIDFDSHLREGYFMDEVYRFEGALERFRPTKMNDGRTHNTKFVHSLDTSRPLTLAFPGLTSAAESGQLSSSCLAGLAATDSLLFGSEEALDDLRQHRLNGERVVGCVRHDCKLVCGPQ